MRFGVLGASRFALRRMIPAMKRARGVEVAAIASRDAAKAEKAARDLGLPRAYGSYEALLGDREIDAIYNPLPNHLHVPWSERAAEAGKHVLCEKPLAMSAEEARRLVAARDRTGRLICEAAMVRVQPRWLAVRELIRKGKIGELRVFLGTFGYQLSSRENVRLDPAKGGGVLRDTGFYPITMSRFCFDEEPVSVLAVTATDPETGVDSLTSAALRFPRGHALLSCGMELAPVQRAQLLGSGGHIDLPNAWTPPPDRPAELHLETSPSLEDPRGETIRFDAADQYTILVELFARAATAGGPGPVPLEDSIRTMAVIDALVRSAASGRAEEVAGR